MMPAFSLPIVWPAALQRPVSSQSYDPEVVKPLCRKLRRTRGALDYISEWDECSGLELVISREGVIAWNF